MSIENILGSLERTYGPTRVLELGKIKIGGLGEKRKARGSGKEFRLPRKDDYFTVTTLFRNAQGDLIEDDELMDELRSEYADEDGKVRKIPVRVMSDDLEDIMMAAFSWYGNKSCAARSDGKTVTWYRDPEPPHNVFDPPLVEDWDDSMMEKQFRGGPMFKLHASFDCVIASKTARWGGVYRFRTTSVISFRQLFASLSHIQTLTGGILMGIPLMLCVRPIQITTPDGKPSTVYVVHCELQGKDLDEVQELALKQARHRMEFRSEIETVQRQYRKLLTHEPPDEEEWVQQEYHPEEDVVESNGSNAQEFRDHVGPMPSNEELVRQEQESESKSDAVAQQIASRRGQSNPSSGTLFDEPETEKEPQEKPTAPKPDNVRDKLEKQLQGCISRDMVTKLYERESANLEGDDKDWLFEVTEKRYAELGDEMEQRMELLRDKIFSYKQPARLTSLLKEAEEDDSFGPKELRQLAEWIGQRQEQLTG